MWVMGHILQVSVRLQMKVGITRGMREDWHVCTRSHTSATLQAVVIHAWHKKGAVWEQFLGTTLLSRIP